MYLWPQKPSQYWFHMCGRANPPKNGSFKHIFLSSGPSKILHPLSEGCGNRLTIWQIRKKQIGRRWHCLHIRCAIYYEIIISKMAMIIADVMTVLMTGARWLRGAVKPELIAQFWAVKELCKKITAISGSFFVGTTACKSQCMGSTARF